MSTIHPFQEQKTLRQMEPFGVRSDGFHLERKKLALFAYKIFQDEL